MQTIQSTTLSFREGNSDKIYQAAIVRDGTGFRVTFAYGRRGSTLQTGTKTHDRVSNEEARAIYHKLVREKTAKGYRPECSTPAYCPAPSDPEDTGVRCQLLNPIDEAAAHELTQSSDWCAQEKHDGRRMLIRRIGNEIVAINRKGLRVGAPAVFIMAAMGIRAEFLLDGEAVGETFHAFDVLELDGRDLRPLPLRQRLDGLFDLLDGRDRGAIRIVPTARLRWEKEAMLAMLQGERREGIVFKHLDEPYLPGRPASGGSQLKYKFVATASCLVSGINGKRSVSLALLDGEKEVPAGNVTIPLNHDIPFVGAVVEVRFLYAFRESGCLYQPVYLGRRDDIDAAECTVAQLKYKSEAATV